MDFFKNLLKTVLLLIVSISTLRAATSEEILEAYYQHLSPVADSTAIYDVSNLVIENEDLLLTFTSGQIALFNL